MGWAQLAARNNVGWPLYGFLPFNFNLGRVVLASGLLGVRLARQFSLRVIANTSSVFSWVLPISPAFPWLRSSSSLGQ